MKYSVVFSCSLLTISIIFLVSPVEPSSILFYNAVGTHSTRLSQKPLMEALADKGHDVTYLSAFKDFEGTTSRIKYYQPQKWSSSFGDWNEIENFYENRKNTGLLEFIKFIRLIGIGTQSCEALLSDPTHLEWMRKQKFDLVIVEGILDDCGLAFVYFWKAKLAYYVTSPLPPWTVDKFGLPDETSSIPDVYAPGFRSNPSFLQRLENALIPVIFAIWREWMYLPKMEGIIREGLGEAGKDMPSLREMEKKAGAVFATSHISLEYPKSYPPNVIRVGGNVVSKKMKPLPKEIEDFIKNSDGFIYVAFGTVVDITTFDLEVQINFIKALGSFPEMNFIWKVDKKPEIPNLPIPDNVLLASWVPQQSILAHPKVKAFVTHSGLGSTAEAVHFGVPVISIPILPGDQDYNGGFTVSKGAGIGVEIVGMKQKELEDAIRNILSDQKYKIAMQRLSKISKDRPAPAVEEAVWWVEYLLRHDHDIHECLVHPSVHQPWWIRRQIDVWVTLGFFLLGLTLVTIFLVFRIGRRLAWLLLCKFIKT